MKVVFIALPIDKEDVFEANIVFAGATLSKAANNFFFKSKFSVTDSITRSAVDKAWSGLVLIFNLSMVSVTNFSLALVSSLNFFFATLLTLCLKYYIYAFTLSQNRYLKLKPAESRFEPGMFCFTL